MSKKKPNPKSELVVLYQEMADLTKPECQHSCRVPFSCCSPEYCEYAAQYAKHVWDTTLEPTGHDWLPFMSATGCIVPPHMRPMCTMHTCDVNGLGFKRGDLNWTEKYFALRNKIVLLERLLPNVDV